MKSLIPALAVCLDTRSARPDGSYFVAIRVTLDRAQRYHSLGFSCTTSDWKKITSPDDLRRTPLEAVRNRANAELTEARRVAATVIPFSHEAFKQAWKTRHAPPPAAPSGHQPVEQDCVVGMLRARAGQLKSAQQDATAQSYFDAANYLCHYLAGGTTRRRGSGRKDAVDLPVPAPLLAVRVTPEWLKALHAWSLRLGYSPSTHSIYVRCLRYVLGTLRDDGRLAAKDYPFGRGRRYSPPACRNPKRALSDEDLFRLLRHEPTPRHSRSLLARSFDFWRMAYLMSGANLADVLRLRHGQVDLVGEEIIFIRHKTNSRPRKIRVTITPLLGQLIQRWKTRGEGDDLLFSFLVGRDTPDAQRRAVRDFVGKTNKHMKTIAAELGIDLSLTTGASRHSFATRLRRVGVSTSLVQEMLGHATERTTQNYYGDFEDSQREYATSLLLPPK